MLVLTRQITGGIDNRKNRAYLELGKSVSIGKLVVTPAVTGAYLDNFYGTTGWAPVTGKVRVDYPLSKAISVFAQGSYQDGLLNKKMDLFYGNGGVRLLF